VLPGCIDTPMLRTETAKGSGRPFELSMLDRLPKTGAYRLMPHRLLQRRFGRPITIATRSIFMSRKRSATRTALRQLIFKLLDPKLKTFCFGVV